MSLLKEENFRTRAITGAFFVGTIIACIYIHPFAFYALVFVIHLLCLKEFYDLTIEEGQRFFKFYALFVLTMVASLNVLNYTAPNLIPTGWVSGFLDILIYFMLFLVLFTQLYYESIKPFSNISFVFLSLFYISAPLVILLMLAFYIFDGYYPDLVMLLFLLVWANDTGAYLTGKLFGKTKLFERISPKKTWEGTIGGIILCMLIAAPYGKFVLQLSPIVYGGLGLIIGVFSTLGDLIESQLKRSLNIKDSGNLLPGHGGFLDRFDGFLMAIPAAFFYLLLMKNLIGIDGVVR